MSKLNLICSAKLGSPASQAKEICMYLSDGNIVQIFDKWDAPSVLRRSVNREMRRYKILSSNFRHLAAQKHDGGFILLAGGLTLMQAKGKLNAYIDQQIEAALDANEKTGHGADPANAAGKGHHSDGNE